MGFQGQAKCQFVPGVVLMHLFNELSPWTNAQFCALVSSSVTEDTGVCYLREHFQLYHALEAVSRMGTQEVLCKLRW